MSTLPPAGKNVIIGLLGATALASAFIGASLSAPRQNQQLTEDKRLNDIDVNKNTSDIELPPMP